MASDGGTGDREGAPLLRRNRGWRSSSPPDAGRAISSITVWALRVDGARAVGAAVGRITSALGSRVAML